MIVADIDAMLSRIGPLRHVPRDQLASRWQADPDMFYRLVQERIDSLLDMRIVVRALELTPEEVPA